MTNRLKADQVSENSPAAGNAKPAGETWTFQEREVLTGVLNQTLGAINTREVVKNGHDSLLAQLISYRMFTTFQPERLKKVETLIKRKVVDLATERDQVGTVESGTQIFALYDKFVDYEVPIPTILELYNKCLQRPVTILTSEQNGYGKTTLAVMLRAFADLMGDFRTLWMTATFKVPPKGPGKPWLVIVDDFLNQYSPDFCHMGKSEEMDSLNDIAMSQDSGDRFLFVTRQSVLDAALASTGARMRCITAAGNVVTLTSNHRDSVCEKLLSGQPELWKEIKSRDPAPESLLYCCKLFVQQRPFAVGKDIFTDPRHALKAGIENVVENDEVAKSVLFLLAVCDDAVEKTSPDDREILKSLNTNVEPDSAIPEFCRQYPDLVVMEDDFVMFASEILRDATLVALWESSSKDLTLHCSVRTLLRLATLGSKYEVGDIESKVSDEITIGKHRDVLQPSFFKDKNYKNIAGEICKDLSNSDTEGCHILFWTGFDLELFEKTASLDENRPRLGIVTLCYWGQTKLQEMLTTCQINLNDSIEEILGQDKRCSKVPFDSGETPLTLAAWRGHHGVVEMLLQEGCKVNTQDEVKKQTALMHYCARRDVHVDFLLEHGADPTLGDKWGMTALHYAVSGPEWNFPDELLTEKTVNARNRRQETPLLLACLNAWSVGAIERLVKAGANLQAATSGGQDCLHAACSSRNAELFSFLLRQSPVSPGRNQDLLELAKRFPSKELIHSRLPGDDAPKQEDEKEMVPCLDVTGSND